MPKRLIVFLIGSFVVVIIAAGIIYRHIYVVPVLMYHSVFPGAGPDNRLVVSPRGFERQMRFLREQRFNVVFLSQLAELVRAAKPIPPKTVAVTFDDGFKNNFTYAFEILKRYQIPATIFIIINEVGRAQGDRLSWEEILLMRDSGLVEFGSHALGPEPLINIVDEQQLRREIFESKRQLEQRVRQPVKLFCYPEGKFNDRIISLVKEAGYSAAAATAPGRSYPDHDPFIIKRLRVSENCANMVIFWIRTSGIYTFIKEKRDD